MILKWSPALELLLVSPSFLHSTCALFLLWGFYILKSFRLLFNHISVSRNSNIYMHVRFSLSRIIMSGLLLGMALSVCTCWFHLASLNCYYWFWYMFVPMFFVQLYPCFLSYVEVYLCTHSIMPFYILFFCQYWACWYYMVYSLIKLLAKSAFAIRLCVQ
jgi:hypothetical protein